MSNRTFCVVTAVLMLTSIAASAWWSLGIWDECREAGHSVMYCMRMVWR